MTAIDLHLAATAISLILLPATTARAADLHVPGTFPTLQAAVDAASPDDRILLADGSYGGVGFADVVCDVDGLDIESVGGPDQCVIDGSTTPGSNALIVTERTDITGITFSGFSTTAGDEGAMRILVHTAFVRECAFRNCTTANESGATTPGSAIAFIDGGSAVFDCVFENNVGSAIYFDPDSLAYIVDCVLENNVTHPTDGRGGGAVLNEGFMLTFTSLYRNNRVEALAGDARGGAIAHLGLDIDLTTPTFEANSVSGPGALSGAAVYISNDFIINNVTVRDHAGAHDGAAIHINWNAVQQASNPLVHGSYENNEVGAIWIEDSSGLLEMRIGSSDFCANDAFDINGPYVNVGANEVCCPGDINASQAVDISDLLSVLSVWGSCSACAQDTNADGAVDVLDLLNTIAVWGACPTLPPSM